jgi:S1-C subfamily serine protease
MNRVARRTVCLAFVLGMVCVNAQDPPALSIPKDFTFTGDTQFVWTTEAMIDLLRQGEGWNPKVSTERPRGGIEVYAKVAPAVVVVRTMDGHGTGFIISPEGHILTNHHVVAQGLQHSNKPSGSYASVHLGRMGTDGVMQLRPEPVRAWLLKMDPTLDLALLKLDAIPQGFAPLPSLQFAPAAPKPGAEATIVGHPASGMLWTLRSGQVASVGRMPADLVDLVMMQLSSSAADRQRVAEELKSLESRRIILTSTGANPGDSGGPVTDGAGRVIAVTFAVPADPARAKFSYHVHLDEVRGFVKNMPTTPMLQVPSPWDFGPRVQLQDVNGDGIPDVLVAGTDGPEVLLFDLDNSTPAAARKDIAALVRDRKWDFEFGLRLVRSESTSAAFYATDNDGTIDLIHVVQDRDHGQNSRFTRAAGNWRVDQNVALNFPSHAYLKDARLGQRLRALLERK